MHVIDNGYTGMFFIFNDNSDRYLKVSFLNNDTMSISNTSNIAQHWGMLHLNHLYRFERLSINSIVITEILEFNKKLTKSNYVKPYADFNFTLDEYAYQKVFPDIVGDTLYFSRDFSRLQVREFCFERVKK